MNDAIKELTPSGKIKRPSYSLVAHWVKDSWDDINPSMIKRSFKCCGISNNINGSEDDLIFDYSRLENVVNNPKRGVEGEEEENEEENEERNEEGNEDENTDDESDYYERNEERNVIQDWR